MATVHSYLRFSTSEQEEGDSIERQDNKAIEFCKKGNHTLSDLRFRDLGRSGFRKKNLKNSALEAFLLAIKAGKIKAGDILYVEAIDRLSRSGIKVTQKIVETIHEAKVDIAIGFPMEQIFKHNTKNQLIDAITLAVYADVAHQYSLRLSGFGKSWWRTARKEARENGTAIAAVIPYWLDREGDGFIVNKEKASVVRLIYKLAIAGKGASKICQVLHERKIKAPRRKTWNKTFVRNVIRDRRSLGEMQFHELDEEGNRVPIGELIPDYYPSIFKNEDTWIKANAKLDLRSVERGPSGDYVNLFQSITFNINDDCPMYLYTYQQNRKSGKVINRRLKSKNAAMNVPNSDTATVDLDAFEFAFLQSVCGINPAAIGKQDNHEAELELAVAKLSSVKKSLAEMQEDLASGADYSHLREPMSNLAIRQKELEKEVKKLTSATASNVSHGVKNLIRIANHNPELRVELREAIKSVVEKIYIMPVKTGNKRNAPVVAACQVVFRTGERFNFIFEMMLGRGKRVVEGIEIPKMIRMENIKLPDLETSTKKWRKGFLKKWIAESEEIRSYSKN